MNKNYLFAGFVVIMMMATVAVPFMASEESDALTPDCNMALNSDRAIIYVNALKGHAFTFTASFDNPDTLLGPTDLRWKLNDLGDGSNLVSFDDTLSVYTAVGTNTVTVYAKNTGSIEIEAYVYGHEAQYRASAVIVVLDSPTATANEFYFWIQVQDDDEHIANGYVNTYGNNTIKNDLSAWNSGFWVHVTSAQVAAAHPSWSFNAKTALDYAVETHTGWAISYLTYGWIDTFMGLGTYAHDIYDEDDEYVSTTYYYWAQYHCSVGAGTWAFNNTTLEFITTQDHAYIGLIFWGSPSANALPDLPNILPTA